MTMTMSYRFARAWKKIRVDRPAIISACLLAVCIAFSVTITGQNNIESTGLKRGSSRFHMPRNLSTLSEPPVDPTMDRYRTLCVIVVRGYPVAQRVLHVPPSW